MYVISVTGRHKWMLAIAFVVFCSSWAGIKFVPAAPRAAASEQAFDRTPSDSAPTTWAGAATASTTETSSRDLVISATDDYTAYLPLTIKPGGGSATLPTIASFQAQSATIQPGETSTLSWSVTGATSLSISPGVGTVTGTSVAVNPTTTTEYTLTASNAAGSVTAKTTVTVATQNPQDPAPFFLPYDINGVTNTWEPSVAVDLNGGVHVAYENRTPGDKEPALYGYCPANCTSADSFTVVPIAGDDDFISDLNLALDPQGRPRLFWHIYNGFRYAECNADCTNTNNWAIATLADRVINVPDLSNRTFALDPQGRPRFVFNDENSFDEHVGTFLLYCNEQCTNPASWLEVKLADQELEKVALAFSSTGLPRMAFQFSDPDLFATRFGYLECDTATCENPPTSFVAFDIHAFYGSYSLQLDSNDRPRLALYSGPINQARNQGDPEPRKSYYFWCEADCGSSVDNWSAIHLSFTDESYQNVALALDSQDRPRLLYESEEGMRYAWCAASCESAAGSWQNVLVDSTDEMNKNEPVPPRSGCTFPTWSVGYHTALALDAADNPYMVYDAQHLWYCNGSVVTDIAWSRFAGLTQP